MSSFGQERHKWYKGGADFEKSLDLDHRSSILDLNHRSSILDFNLRSSILDPRLQSSIIDPRSSTSIIDPRSSTSNADHRSSILDPDFDLRPRSSTSIFDLDLRPRSQQDLGVKYQVQSTLTQYLTRYFNTTCQCTTRLWIESSLLLHSTAVINTPSCQDLRGYSTAANLLQSYIARISVLSKIQSG